MNEKPPFTFEESLALSEERRRKALNKHLEPACIVHGGSLEDKLPPPDYRLLPEEEKTGEWVMLGLMWSSSAGDTNGIRHCWESNFDEKGWGVYTEPGYVYSVPK